MTYSVKSDEVTDEKWKEMKDICSRYVCAQCEKELTIHTNPEEKTLEVGCLVKGHSGWLEKTTAVQEYRRAGQLETYSPDLGRQMNLLALRYPKAIVDMPTAALFITDCMRLGLDPLIQPAEIVPVPFTYHGGKPDEKKIVQEIVTVDGWLSMAARGCPEKWAGAPSIEPVFDENLAESLSGDKKAWVYKASGHFRLDDGTISPVSTVYGYFTQAEYQLSRSWRTPAADNPGNQAAIRASKRWVRQNFPDCRQRMMELYKEWRQRAQGIKEVEEYIDAEYSVLDEKEAAAAKPGGKSGAKADKKVTTKKKASGAEGNFGADAEVKSGEFMNEVKREAEVVERETSKADAAKFHEAGMSPTPEQASAASEAEPEGFGIDLAWLKDALGELKWNDNTCKTFLVSQYKVSPTGTLEEVISRLTRVQAEEFVNEIQSRQSSKPRHLL